MLPLIIAAAAAGAYLIGSSKKDSEVYARGVSMAKGGRTPKYKIGDIVETKEIRFRSGDRQGQIQYPVIKGEIIEIEPFQNDWVYSVVFNGNHFAKVTEVQIKSMVLDGINSLILLHLSPSFRKIWKKGGVMDESSIESKIKQLEGEYIALYLMGVKEPEYEKITKVSVTPDYFTHRDISVKSSYLGTSVFPLSQLDSFLKGKQIEIKGGKEVYVIKLIKSKYEDGGKTGGKVDLRDDAQRFAKPSGWRWKEYAVTDGIVTKNQLAKSPTEDQREEYPEYVYYETRKDHSDKKPSYKYKSI